MKMRFLSSLVLTGTLLAAPAAAEETGTEMPIEIGQPFPTLTLPSIADGSPMSVTEFRGKKVLLHIWASW
jgi:hypothetical protein